MRCSVFPNVFYRGQMLLKQCLSTILPFVLFFLLKLPCHKKDLITCIFPCSYSDLSEPKQKPVSPHISVGALILPLFVGDQSLSHVCLFLTPWTAACQASLSFTISRSLLKLMPTEPVMLSNCFILSCLLLPLVILEKTQESSLDCKEIKPVNPPCIPVKIGTYFHFASEETKVQTGSDLTCGYS